MPTSDHMKTILAIAALALATGCASTAQLGTEAQAPISQDQAAPTADVDVDEDLTDDLTVRQRASVALADHLVEAQPGEAEVDYLGPEQAEPEPVKPRKALARPEMVSTKKRFFYGGGHFKLLVALLEAGKRL